MSVSYISGKTRSRLYNQFLKGFQEELRLGGVPRPYWMNGLRRRLLQQGSV